ncbi:hypothetical protein [Hyalangium sp.]|uniref:hypothetical protein n=1 Tax=Hyalangium sp. TaxID=2028555 RepID=UPI002D68A2F9|nr:hypothetical protein [Hyalangium sp.]HYI02842.1 hypothetical protein [Hyalangium sp.]
MPNNDKPDTSAAQPPGGGILAGRLFASMMTALYGQDRVITGSMKFIEEQLNRGVQPILVVVEEEGRTLGDKELRMLEEWATSPKYNFNLITLCADISPSA